jgi:3-deoxy-D-manno-octulosonic acid kinase
MRRVPVQPPPPGYIRLSVGDIEVVSAERCAEAVCSAMESPRRTLHDYARAHRKSKAFAGRGLAYSAPLPGTSERVVVRHNRHGGLLAPFTRDLFASPTRAPIELDASLRLRAAGVPTPEIVAYATYPAGGGLRRVDVATAEIADAFDLSVVLTGSDASLRTRAWAAVVELLRRLSAAGARHHDLNVKNVLLRTDAGALEAMVLDVDRVTFEHGDVTAPNVARLSRSARKWRQRQGATVDESELAGLARSAFEASLPAVTRS